MALNARETSVPKGAVTREGLKTLAYACEVTESGKAGRDIRKELMQKRDPIHDLLQKILG